MWGGLLRLLMPRRRLLWLKGNNRFHFQLDATRFCSAWRLLVFGFDFFVLPTAHFGCCRVVVAFPCIVICLFGCCRVVVAFPCIVIGLLASPLCGAALTFFAAAKKVSKESGLTPPARSEPSRSSPGNGPTQDPPLHHPR